MNRVPYDFYRFASIALMISLARSAMGFKSAYSGLTTSKYLPSADNRLVGGTSSFGISRRGELGGSSASPNFCKAIWPFRERNQLINTLAALGRGAWFSKLSDPPPDEKLEPYFHLVVSKSSTGSPWFLALIESLQPKQIAYLPCANQSVICRKFFANWISMVLKNFLMNSGPISGL